MAEKTPVYAAIAIVLITLIIGGILTYIYSNESQFFVHKGGNKPPRPIINISKDVINTNESVTFSARGSYDIDGKITKYVWDFDDGTVVEGIEVNHTYHSGGWYNVSLTVEDDSGKVAIKTLRIYVNYIPIAKIRILTTAKTYHIDDVITFDASDSYDTDGKIIRYAWDFGDGGKEDGQKVSHKYKSLGRFTVKLTVWDDRNASDTEEITIDIVEREFEVTWLEREEKVFEDEGSTNEGETTELTVNITTDNILTVEIVLEWQDDLPLPSALGLRKNEPDELGLEVISPEGERKGNNSTTQKNVITFILNNIPGKTTIKGATEADARDYAIALYGSNKGIGSWTIKIMAIYCGDGLLFNGGIFPDNGNSWSLTIYVKYYTPQLREI